MRLYGGRTFKNHESATISSNSLPYNLNNIMNLKSIIASSIILAFSATTAFASRQDAYTGSRIFWDTTTRTTVFSVGNYARVIQLQDGRLMAVAEHNGIEASFSSNMGDTWTSPEKIVTNSTNLPNAVPDLIQLTDGTIIVGYNPRPSSPYSEERRFGIRCIRSTDNAKTWSAPIFIFDASYLYNDGCWEPSFLELPSGELQCYFANEAEYTYSSEQCISMSRSFDKGLTWGEPEKISYRAGSRDGMPVPILLKDKSEIVVIIEDNGWGQAGFTATTVRTTLEDNWSSGYVPGGSSKRSMIFAETPDNSLISAAPYLRMLPSGETIASYQGNENRKNTDYLTMFVEVGDSAARNFKARSNPFLVSDDGHCMWNSVAVVDTGVVMAVGSIGDSNTANYIDIIKGYPRKHFTADYGTPVVDGASSGDTWTYKSAQQVLMGQSTNSRMTGDFLYDDENLYFTMRIIDRNIVSDKVDNDGVYLYLDLENACDVYPRTGMFQLFFDVNGTVSMKYGVPALETAGKWVTSDEATVDSITYAVTLKSFYYEFEAAIPWKILGYDAPPVGQAMRADISVRNRTDSSLEYENIPETNTLTGKPNSWAWMGFMLNPKSAGVTDIETNTAKEVKIATISKGTLAVSSDGYEIVDLAFYSFDGSMLYKSNNCGSYHELSISGKIGGILAVKLSNGRTSSYKILF